MEEGINPDSQLDKECILDPSFEQLKDQYDFEKKRLEDGFKAAKKELEYIIELKQKSILTLKDKIIEKDEELQKLREQFDLFKEKSNHDLLEKMSLEGKFSNLERSLLDNTSSPNIEEAFAKIDRLFELREELQSAKETINELNIIISTERIKNQHGSQSENNFSKIEEELKKQIDQLRKQNIESKSEISQQKVEIESLNKILSGYRRREKEQQEHVNELTKENMNIEQELAEMRNKNLSLNAQTMRLESILNEQNEYRLKLQKIEVETSRKHKLYNFISQRFNPDSLGIEKENPAFDFFSSLRILFKLLSVSDLQSQEITKQLANISGKARDFALGVHVEEGPADESRVNELQALLEQKIAQITDLEEEREDYLEQISDFERNDPSPALVVARQRVKELEAENQSLRQRLENFEASKATAGIRRAIL